MSGLRECAALSTAVGAAAGHRAAKAAALKIIVIKAMEGKIDDESDKRARPDSDRCGK